MVWLWYGLGLLACVLAVMGVIELVHLWLCRRYIHFVERIFQEKPLFMSLKLPPLDDAEEVHFPTTNGLTLRGCYLKTRRPRRRGVILFGIEFDSNRYSCVPYTEALRNAGYDIFSYEPRNQGESDALPDYEPLQWVTRYEVEDAQAAIAYLKERDDADAKGIGFFGMSRGACAGLLAGARDPMIRCFVTDGVYGTRTTMLPYMRKWVALISHHYWVQHWLPTVVYRKVADTALSRVSAERACVFLHVEDAMKRLGRRPLLMIHGGDDSYIKPEMARSLWERARDPKELWIVAGAKHNQALQVANGEYTTRIVKFFEMNLARPEGDRDSPPVPEQVPA